MKLWKNRLRVLGGVIVILGCLLPWQCYQGFSSGCSRMVDLSPMRVFFSSPEHFILTTLGVALLGLLMNTAGLGIGKILVLFTDFLYLISPFLIYQSMYFRGPFSSYTIPQSLNLIIHFLFMVTGLLGLFVSWLAVPWGIYNRIPKGIMSISSALLSLTAFVCTGFVLFEQLSRSVVDQEVRLQLGLPMIILGSLIIFFSQAQTEPVGGLDIL